MITKSDAHSPKDIPTHSKLLFEFDCFELEKQHGGGFFRINRIKILVGITIDCKTLWEYRITVFVIFPSEFQIVESLQNLNLMKLII